MATMEARPRRLAVFKIELTPYSPPEDDACPWVWECAGESVVGGFCAGGSGVSQRQAFDRGRSHALRRHGVRI